MSNLNSCEYWSVWKYSDRRDDGSPCDKCGRREGAEDADEDWHECEHAELGRDCPRTCDFDNDPGSTFKLFVYYWRTLDVVRIYGQQNFVDAENEIWEEEHAESP